MFRKSPLDDLDGDTGELHDEFFSSRLFHTGAGNPLDEISPSDLRLAAVTLPRLFQNVDMAKAGTIETLLTCKHRPIPFSLLRAMKRITFALKLGFLNAEDIETPSMLWIPSHHRMEICPTHVIHYARHVRAVMQIFFLHIVDKEWGDQLDNDIDDGDEVGLPPREAISLSVDYRNPPV